MLLGPNYRAFLGKHRENGITSHQLFTLFIENVITPVQNSISGVVTNTFLPLN